MQIECVPAYGRVAGWFARVLVYVCLCKCACVHTSIGSVCKRTFLCVCVGVFVNSEYSIGRREEMLKAV